MKGRIKRYGDSSTDMVIHLFGDGGELIHPVYGKNKFGADYEAKEKLPSTIIRQASRIHRI
jgi:hypothetical protein